MNLFQETQITKVCIIWMHGLGADASDMKGLVEQPQFAGLEARHVFLDAPIRPVTINAGMAMRAWYDIIGVQLTDREDHEGVFAAAEMINQAIEEQINAGFQSDQIILAGFSQGGAMALYTALQNQRPLAGVIALSAYLPLARDCEALLPHDTPIFLASGRYDPIVLPQWTALTHQWLKQHEYKQISIHEYDMEHQICLEEINDLTQWLHRLIAEVA